MESRKNRNRPKAELPEHQNSGTSVGSIPYELNTSSGRDCITCLSVPVFQRFKLSVF